MSVTGSHKQAGKAPSLRLSEDPAENSRLLASRTVREYVSIVLSHPVCSRRPRKQIQYLSTKRPKGPQGVLSSILILLLTEEN